MTSIRRQAESGFDPDEIENDDPLGEQAFAEAGFQDGPDGGPAFSAPGLEEDDKRPGGRGQKVAGVPESRQHEVNTPSDQHPDSGFSILKRRPSDEKGDPSVGGTRPD